MGQRWFLNSDTNVANFNAHVSQARRELQDLVKDSLITATASYGGNYVYTRNPPTLLKMRWRKTQPDTSSMPRYY